ncbi:MAG: cellulase N-terminal Ig-like domain-containing protein, partial [Verrucomicrobiota bacterium]|nr:cellulase N-terminal Ig-like domain-containing protein [Verrucomicrobiota bacterium]
MSRSKNVDEKYLKKQHCFIDNNQVYRNKPVLTFASADNLNCQIELMLQNWNTVDLRAHFRCGFITFMAKSQNGTGSMRCGVSDKILERRAFGGKRLSRHSFSKDFFILSKEWKSYKIPLLSLFISKKPPDSQRFFSVLFEGQRNDVYSISDIKIISNTRRLTFGSVRINQCGYKTDAIKKVIVAEEELSDTTFSIKDSDNKIVFSGLLEKQDKR